MTKTGFSQNNGLLLFTQVAAFAFAEFAAETLLNENVQALLQGNYVYILDDLAGKGIHKQVTCLVGRDTALLHVEECVFVQLSHG
jgi:hypothetical protein